MQHYQDPAILFKAQYESCIRKQYHEVWFSKVIDNNVTIFV